MPEQPTTSLVRRSPDLGQALGAVLRSYLDGAREVLSELPGGPRGYQVMRMSADDSCSNQGAMAKELGLDRTVMTYLVDELEQAGLVERRSDPHDRRARRIALTDAGWTRLESVSGAIADVERHVLVALDDGEVDLLRRLLGKVVSDDETVGRAACSETAETPAC